MYNLLGAVMRGITANNNDVNFALKGRSVHLNEYHLISQLVQEHVKQFEVVERGDLTYFISRPHASTGELCVYIDVLTMLLLTMLLCVSLQRMWKVP